MARDMAKILMVLFYLVATDKSSFSARTLVIHKEKFNVLLSDDKPIDLSNIVKHLRRNAVEDRAISGFIGQKSVPE